MQILHRVVTALFAAILSGSGAASAQAIPDEWRKPAWEMVAFFETSGANFSAVTNDFDCNGVSVGILQWNVGKRSFQEEFLAHIKREVVTAAMPKYGAALWSAHESDLKAKVDGKPPAEREALLTYVSGFQTYANRAECASRKRQAAWTEEGKSFRTEMRALLTSPEVTMLQEEAVNQKLIAGWQLANEWSEAKYGATGLQSFEEFSFFVDAVNFNGTWWKANASFAKVCALRSTMTDEALHTQIIDYLASDLPDQLQTKEAERNVTLWRPRTPTSDELDLMTMAYLISKHIGAKNAVQFKKNVISRRGTIVFNDGWVNGVRKIFPRPAGGPPDREGRCPPG